ncbi:winged helix-turn-helix domain-containing protein [Actinosynnema sp. NPDC059797]
MGLWRIDTDTLARGRFVVSRFAEVFASLRLLDAGVGAHPGEDAWLRAHLPAYRAHLAADPVAGPLVRAAIGPSWIADFFCPTPGEGEGFERTAARVRATGAERARADLRASLRGPLPAVLDRDDLPERATALLTHVRERAVRPHWEHRRRVLEADVAARTAHVGRGGWAAVLDSLKPGTRWLGGSRFRVNRTGHPPREVAARAGLLVLLGTPLSTTQLVALTGQGLGSVGRHLRVLRDAGLVERRRAGRSVLYARTEAGRTPAEASGAGAP